MNLRTCNSAGLGTDSDMPDHDLEPPRFSRKALERLLNDWPAVQCMIMSGVSENGTNQLFGDQGQLCRQSGTALLDKFTHTLLVKCSAEVSEIIICIAESNNLQIIITIYMYKLYEILTNFYNIDRCLIHCLPL